MIKRFKVYTLTLNTAVQMQVATQTKVMENEEIIMQLCSASLTVGWCECEGSAFLLVYVSRNIQSRVDGRRSRSTLLCKWIDIGLVLHNYEYWMLAVLTVFASHHPTEHRATHVECLVIDCFTRHPPGVVPNTDKSPSSSPRGIISQNIWSFKVFCSEE